MPIVYYRAVKSLSAAEQVKVHRWRPTMRLPTNVPYIVDNLWEFLRPADMPSRRHAVYVSPSPQLALQCAARPEERDGFSAYEVEIVGDYTITQLSVEDARYHSDVAAVLTLVKAHQPSWQGCEWTTRLRLGMLFAAGSTKTDWNRLVDEDATTADFVNLLMRTSQFWKTANPPRTNCNGELFFELRRSSHYCMRVMAGNRSTPNETLTHVSN